MLELAVSVGLFLFLAATITLAISSAQHNQITVSQQASLRAIVTADLQNVAGQSYAAVTAGTLSPPNPCAGNAAESCVTVGGRTYTIAYQVCPADPSTPCTSATGTTVPASATTTPSPYTDVTATVTNSSTVAPVTQRVLAPFNTFATTTTGVLVTLNAPQSAQTGTVLYLLDQSNATVTSGAVSSDSVLLAVPTGYCTPASPCHIGLSSGPGYDANTAGTLALYASSALAPVSVTSGSLTNVSVSAFAPAATPTTVSLVAQNSGAPTTAPSSVINTVCLWGSFNDGVANRLVPFCNNVSASSITLAQYAPDSATPTVLFDIAPTTPITLSVDNPSGTCPATGAYVYSSSNTWTSGAECTSWTWGVPDGFGAAGSLTPVSVNGVDATPGIDHYTGVVTAPVFNNGAGDEMLWSDLSMSATNAGDIPGSPAAGYAGEPTWSMPRAASSTGCASDGTCGSLVGQVAPEASICPLLHCLTSALFAPYLASPSPATVTMQNGVASFDLTFADPSTTATITATLVSPPTSGSLTEGGVALVSGQTVATGSSPLVVALGYTSSTPASAPNDSFQLRLSDGQTGSSSTVTVSITNGQVVASVTATPNPISVAQGGSATAVTLHVADANGAAIAGVSLNLSTLVTSSSSLYDASGLAVTPSTVTTDSSGNAVVNVTASASTPSDTGGTNCPCYGLNVASATNSSITVVPLTVTAALTSVVVSPYANPTTSATVTAPQSSTSTIYGSALSASGAVVPSTALTFSVACSVTGYTTCPYLGLITTTPTSCTTTSSACSVSLVIPATAPATSASVAWTITASNGSGVTATATLDVTAVLASLTTTATSPVAPGGSVTVTVTALDGAGNPMAGYNVAVASSSSDLPLSSATVTTNASGVATDTGTVSSTAPVESITITASASTVSPQYPMYTPVISSTATVSVT